MSDGPQPYPIRWDGGTESIQYPQNGQWYSIPNGGFPSGVPFVNLTTTQKNAITLEGTVVYDITLHKLCVRTASVWETITSA